MPRKKKAIPIPESDARHYKLTSGIPIPPPQFQPDRYPLKRMKVGQSFGFPDKEEQRVRSGIARYRQTAKSVKFTIRREKKKGRCRVWRIT